VPLALLATPAVSGPPSAGASWVAALRRLNT
jgi:hypothetical protein